MGLDLTILPQYDRGANFSHDIINLDRDSDLFDIIGELENIKGQPVPRGGINSFLAKSDPGKEYCYGAITETVYGDRMKSLLAGELKAALKEYKADHWRNRAFIAFLNEMPDDLEIWLYWD